MLLDWKEGVHMNKALKNDRGFILITVLLLLMLITIIGIIAINISTVGVQIGGNQKRVSTAFEGADGGVDLAISVIENTLAAGTLNPTSFTIPGSSNSIDTANLGNEISGGSDYDTDTASLSPDISISNLNGVQVNVDIDRMYAYALPGSSLEFASGYEGAGAGAAGGGIGVLYIIDSQGTR